VSGRTAACPAEPDLLDYLLGELAPERCEALDDHVFGCAACAGRLAVLELLREAVADAARHGAVAANVNAAFVERALRDGLVLSEYRIAAGGAVPCRAGPEDLWVVRLAGELGGVGELRLEAELHDLEHEVVTSLPGREVVADREAGEVILVFPGDRVRAYPRSRWTLRLRGETAGGPVEIGLFYMDHTP
jgi:hypothetical protein